MVVRSSRHVAADRKQCSICLEDYFDTPDGRERVLPVKLGCQHVFCRECIETHLSSNIRCPVPWCEAQLPLQPHHCELCAYWERSHADSLVLTVRAQEMASSIKDGLDQLAAESHFFKIPKKAKERLMAHVRGTLARYEWQFHSGIDLAELLDPFLLAIDRTKARAHYGAKLSASAPDPTVFPTRGHDPDDYPTGQEPWIAAFFRQWALDYEKENGEVKQGWGVWTKPSESDGTDWEWPYKRILAHKTETNSEVRYLVKWVGQRFPASWIRKEQLTGDAHMAYDKAHGVVHAE